MTTWQKSTFSDDNGCVELAALDSDDIGVRDDKLGEDSPVLHFTRVEMLAFLQGAKAGEFDHLV